MATKAKKTKTKTSRLTRELLETAHDMHASGIMPNVAYEKITMRYLGETLTTPATMKLSPEEIRALRVGAHLSQAVFAHFLNLTAGYVSQLERSEKRPTGAALALLNVIKRKGIQAIL
jgi:putative transcriptional regulator